MTTADPRTMTAAEWNTRFTWKPQPEAQALVDELIAESLETSRFAATLAEQMRELTATRFKDWVCDLSVEDDPRLRQRLEDAGFTLDESIVGRTVYQHTGGLFPLIALAPSGSPAGARRSLTIKVESVVDFCAAHHLAAAQDIHGGPGEQFRLMLAASEADHWFQVVEQHGGHWLRSPGRGDHAMTRRAAQVLEAFRLRRRTYGTPNGLPADLVGEGPRVPDHGHTTADVGFDDLQRLAEWAVGEIGQGWACDCFFDAERRYWMRRNRAAQVQYERQQRLGLGWANHDHHTYRCSRRNYHRVIRVLETLGMFCRERFYAGADAGWGAQVLEHPAGFVVFADVDMSAEEIDGDFSHLGFADAGRGDGSDRPSGDGEARGLGTVGLWCELHGESMFEAGMHHLECQFDHHALTAQLAGVGLGMMDPFTTFPFLRQAFTQGERFQVDGWRLERLVRLGSLSAADAERFQSEGALGSHLENLERNDGFKGFNQRGVSDIISRTDARRH